MNAVSTLCIYSVGIGWTQYTEREHAKQVLKKIFISVTLLVAVALILKVVRNLFQTFHLDSLLWFRYRMIVACVT